MGPQPVVQIVAAPPLYIRAKIRYKNRNELLEGFSHLPGEGL